MFISIADLPNTAASSLVQSSTLEQEKDESVIKELFSGKEASSKEDIQTEKGEKTQIQVSGEIVLSSTKKVKADNSDIFKKDHSSSLEKKENLSRTDEEKIPHLPPSFNQTEETKEQRDLFSSLKKVKQSIDRATSMLPEKNKREISHSEPLLPSLSNSNQTRQIKQRKNSPPPSEKAQESMEKMTFELPQEREEEISHLESSQPILVETMKIKVQREREISDIVSQKMNLQPKSLEKDTHKLSEAHSFSLPSYEKSPTKRSMQKLHPSSHPSFQEREGAMEFSQGERISSKRNILTKKGTEFSAREPENLAQIPPSLNQSSHEQEHEVRMEPFVEEKESLSLSLKNEGTPNQFDSFIEKEESSSPLSEEIREKMNQLQEKVKEQISLSIRTIARGKNSKAMLLLKPQFLGKIEIALSLEGKNMNLRFSVENQTTHRLIQDNLSPLRENLQREGWHVEEGQVQLELSEERGKEETTFKEERGDSQSRGHGSFNEQKDRKRWLSLLRTIRAKEKESRHQEESSFTR